MYTFPSAAFAQQLQALQQMAGVTSTGGAGTITASMVAHPVGWAIGAIIVVGGLGYMIYKSNSRRVKV